MKRNTNLPQQQNRYIHPIHQGPIYNSPYGRPQVNDTARALPDSHELTKQFMAQEDAQNATSKYIASSQSGVSGTTSLSDSGNGDYGFLTFNVVLDSARFKRSSYGASPNTFHDGQIQFDFPQIGNLTYVSNVVALDLFQFFLPQRLTDTSLHPDYYFDQFIGVQVNELNTESNIYQPIIGNGVNAICLTATPSGTSITAYPMSTRIAFNRPIPTVDRISMTFYRLSRNPNVAIFEPLNMPKTVIQCVYKPHLIPLDPLVNNRFQVINDSVDEFITLEAYLVTPTFKAAVNMNLLSDDGILTQQTKLYIDNINGWYASGFDFVNNTFLVNGLDLSAYETQVNNGAVISFNVIIMPNRITIAATFVCRTGAKTNDISVIL